LAVSQEQVDFAIPYLDEDVPLCLDPFLLWKSPSLQDNGLHTALVNSFNHLGHLYSRGQEERALEMLVQASECDEVGLGFSPSRQGVRIGKTTANEILSLFNLIPQLKENGFFHFEEIQLCVDQISKDRVSDIACSFLKSFLIDFTIDQCEKLGIPMVDAEVDWVYDFRTNTFKEKERVKVPVNPETGTAVLLVPKRWLRRAPWITCEDYIDNYFLKHIAKDGTPPADRVAVLGFNRQNYDVVQVYVKQKEKAASDCRNDPLFKPIAVYSAKGKLAQVTKLASGKDNNADKKYEAYVCQLLASLLYPHLDFADEQVRTESGSQIRDLIFYNSRAMDFLRDIHADYGSRQIVFELKNVRAVEREHINQLNRYLGNEFGGFGVLVTRHPLPKPMFKNTVDLWSGQRRCIVAITDVDLELMVNVYESRQREPIEVLKRAYIEFVRACPR
jgi:hypothetical protein